MATSFKVKAVAELREAKKLEREREAQEQAESEKVKADKAQANAERIAAKLERIAKGVESTPPVEEVAVEEVVEEVL